MTTGGSTPVVHGIDFGTSTSMIMIGARDRPELLVRDPAATQGQVGIPTSVCARSDGTLAVGHEAERIKRLRIRDYRTGFKLEIGRQISHQLGTTRLTPEQLMTTVIQFLRSRALADVATEPDLLVMTVPVAWEGRTRDFAMEACVEAGYDPVRIQLRTEPVAALASLDVGPGTTLVYDFGGGTFDCVVALDTGTGPQVLGSAYGLPDVGGRALDDRVLRYLRDTFPQVEEIFAAHASSAVSGSVVDAAALISRFQLRERCVQAKIDLSVFEFHQELLSELEPPEMFELDCARLNDLIKDLVAATVDECERMLRELGMAWSDIDRCVLVGGSSRVPLVRERLEARSKQQVIMRPEPELAVVRGATAVARGIAWPAPAARQRAVQPPSHEASPGLPSRNEPARALRPFTADRNLFDEI